MMDPTFLTMLMAHRDVIADLLPTSHQMAVLRAIHAEPLHQTTSAALARTLGLSVQNASTQLARLHRMGYLCRSEQPSASGGSEFVYWSRVALPVEQL